MGASVVVRLIDQSLVRLASAFMERDNTPT
ncbi:MAG: hypothetical protein N5P05_004129 (plasmid) [Chroococcopsis gigantea SAG 12.99]|nr:hypothetical protein [Chroococcopsis gigantea SAG 12.99]